MKRFNLLIVSMLFAVSMMGQNLLPVFIGVANKCAAANLKGFRERLGKEYKVKAQDLDTYYRSCRNNWGNVSVALEVARTSGKQIKDVCKSYRDFGSKGWLGVLKDLKIQPGTPKYKDFSARILHHQKGWNDFYKHIDPAHLEKLKKAHELHEKYQKYKKWEKEHENDED